VGEVKEVKEVAGEGEEGEEGEQPQLQPEVQALGQRARELLEEALAAGDAAATAAARVTEGGSAAGGAAGGLAVDEEERKDAISAAAKARALLARMLIGGEFVKRHVLLGRRLLLQASLSSPLPPQCAKHTLAAHTDLFVTLVPP